MANYKNAYATRTPNNNNMVDFITDVENQDFRYRAEKRLKDKEAEEQAKAKDEKLQKLAEFNQKFKPYDTGSASYNSVVTDALSQGKDKYLELYKIANDRGKTDADRMKAMADMKELENLPEYLKNISQRFTEVNSVYKSAVDKGEAWDNPEWNKKFQNGFKGLKIQLDDDLKPTMLFLNPDSNNEWFDQNKDGVIDFMKYDEITQLLPENLIVPKIDMFNMAQKAVKTLKARTDETYDPNNPYKTTETKGVPKEDLEALAEQMMSPQALTSWAIEHGINRQLTEDEKLKIKNDLIESMIPYTERGVKETLDQKAIDAKKKSDADRASREKIAKMNEAGRNARANTKASGGKKTTASIDEFNNYSVIVEKKGIPKGSLGYNPKGGNINYIPTQGIEEEMDQFYITPDGALIITGTRYELDENGKTKSKKPFSYNSKNQANEVGKRVSVVTKSGTDETYDTIQEFKDDLLKNKNVKSIKDSKEEKNQSEANEFGI